MRQPNNISYRKLNEATRVAKGIIDGKSYPTTFRRMLIDFAGKLIYTGRRIILKVSQYVYKRLNIPLIWERCNNPLKISRVTED